MMLGFLLLPLCVGQVHMTDTAENKSAVDDVVLIQHQKFQAKATSEGNEDNVKTAKDGIAIELQDQMDVSDSEASDDGIANELDDGIANELQDRMNVSESEDSDASLFAPYASQIRWAAKTMVQEEAAGKGYCDRETEWRNRRRRNNCGTNPVTGGGWCRSGWRCGWKILPPANVCIETCRGTFNTECSTYWCVANSAACVEHMGDVAQTIFSLVSMYIPQGQALNKFIAGAKYGSSKLMKEAVKIYVKDNYENLKTRLKKNVKKYCKGKFKEKTEEIIMDGAAQGDFGLALSDQLKELGEMNLYDAALEFVKEIDPTGLVKLKDVISSKRCSELEIKPPP